MRRTASVILFIVGGWLLASGVMTAGFYVGEGAVAQFLPAAVMAGISAPFLLLGTWASPGNRLADLGMTLMVVAAIGGGLMLMMWLVTSDPGFKQLFPVDRPMPSFQFAPVSESAAVLLLAGGGYLLWRLGRKRARRDKQDLEHIFGNG